MLRRAAIFRTCILVSQARQMINIEHTDVFALCDDADGFRSIDEQAIGMLDANCPPTIQDKMKGFERRLL